jgi:hypothetical protein
MFKGHFQTFKRLAKPKHQLDNFLNLSDKIKDLKFSGFSENFSDLRIFVDGTKPLCSKTFPG